MSFEIHLPHRGRRSQNRYGIGRTSVGGIRIFLPKISPFKPGDRVNIYIGQNADRGFIGMALAKNGRYAVSRTGGSVSVTFTPPAKVAELVSNSFIEATLSDGMLLIPVPSAIHSSIWPAAQLAA